MKVLVPIDVDSQTSIDAAIKAVLSTEWPPDVKFYLLNVIEEGDGLEHRVHVLSDIMSTIHQHMRQVPIYTEVSEGERHERIIRRAEEIGADRIIRTH